MGKTAKKYVIDEEQLSALYEIAARAGVEAYKEEHKGTDFLNMLGRMVRITGLCEEIGLIDCGRMPYRHTRQYFVNADGDLKNGL